MRLSGRLTLSTLALTLAILPATAETIVSQTYNGAFPASITGTLADQGTVLEESFTLTSAGSFTAFTSSYANGGFEPNLTLYNGSGIAIANQWATPGPGATADPNTALTADGYLTASNLAAGTYTLTLTDWELQQNATATSLSDGFKSDYGNGTTFMDAQGNTRSGDYAVTVDFAGVNTAIPEPGTIALLAPALVGAWFMRKRIKSLN